jgi:hypothetical protein
MRALLLVGLLRWLDHAAVHDLTHPRDHHAVAHALQRGLHLGRAFRSHAESLDDGTRRLVVEELQATRAEHL